MEAEAVGYIRVLNVNDDPSSRYVATRVLRRAGFEVVEAETGRSGVELARAHRPQVAVLDVRLPDISGLDVCKTLKSDPSTSSILVVQTSASYVTSANRAEGLTAGADAYLAQPFEAEELVATIHSLLRGRRLEVEARRRADALTEADQRKDEFLAMLAHELRNPLSAIVTAARMLQANDGHPTTKLSATIERQAHHLSRLVDDLLDISRITHGKIQLKREPLDLNEAVGRAVETCRPGVERKRQTLRVARGREVTRVDADPVRLEQILCNLIGNASKYTPDEGIIDVEIDLVIRDGKPRGRVVVTDSGIGLSPVDRDHIFDLFYQVDTSVARAQSGLGIGLTMAKRLVEMHEGTIHVESAGRGKGAKFTVELPESTPGPALGAAPEAPAGDLLQGARVLLVDDNADACELLQLCLQDAGCLVETAGDGREALRALDQRTFDVAVLDIGLPDLDGYQVASTVVEQFGAQRPRLVALTGYGRAEDRGRALVSGFDAHLVKPVDPRRVTKTIDQLLRQARVRLG